MLTEYSRRFFTSQLRFRLCRVLAAVGFAAVFLRQPSATLGAAIATVKNDIQPYAARGQVVVVIASVRRDDAHVHAVADGV